jgi:hypothetical protein
MVVREVANSSDLSSKIELRAAFREARLGMLVVALFYKHVDGADVPVASNSDVGQGIKGTRVSSGR